MPARSAVADASRPLSPPPMTATSTSARRTSMSGPESEAEVHQVRIEVPSDTLPVDDFQVGELAGRLVTIAERWATGCIADRHAEISEL